MSSKGFVLGLDIGTTSVKAAIVDAANREVVGEQEYHVHKVLTTGVESFSKEIEYISFAGSN